MSSLHFSDLPIALTGDIHRDVPAFLIANACPQTAKHCGDVAREARRIALLFKADPEQATMAGWLHDVSAIYPAHERVQVARRVGLEVLPEEEKLPMIIHQKLSRWLAEEVFHITQPQVLSAVECHTTLKANASLLDKVLFVADKLAWDQPGKAPFHDGMLNAITQSLDAAAFYYLRYMWEKRNQLPVLHPWLRDAYMQFKDERFC